MNYFKKSFLTLAVTSALSTAAVASTHEHNAATDVDIENKVVHMDHESWVSVKGKITEIDDDEFVLDYGAGEIEVELDEGNFDKTVYALREGERVAVTGMIDDDFLDESSIDAASVRVESQSMTYYSDERTKKLLQQNEMKALVNAADSSVTLVGTVKSTSELSDEVTLSVEGEEVTIDVSELGFDPLDDDSNRTIRTGDTIKVKAHINDALFDDYNAVATSVNRLEI